MDNGGLPVMGVSEFVDLLNQTYEYAFPSVVITGELANLRVSKGKWVYFDLKDATASIKCFGTVYMLPGPLEEGMLLQVKATPHQHQLYGFSMNVQNIQAAGEGSIRRAAELLARLLQAEGLFDPARKRPLPYPPRRIGLITSGQSAAYADFVKVLAARWGGLDIMFVDVQVQGEAAVPQIVAAIERFNGLSDKDRPEVLVLTRGGGSADDLAAWSHEQVTRAVAASTVPTLVAIGHEIDTSLAELAADQRASTPSNAAEMLVPDRRPALEALGAARERLYAAAQDTLHDQRQLLADFRRSAGPAVQRSAEQRRTYLDTMRQLLTVLSPQAALRRGYAVVRLKGAAGKVVRTALDAPAGATVYIELAGDSLQAKVTAHTKQAEGALDG